MALLLVGDEVNGWMKRTLSRWNAGLAQMWSEDCFDICQNEPGTLFMEIGVSHEGGSALNPKGRLSMD
jgi:hypothetical protein